MSTCGSLDINIHANNVLNPHCEDITHRMENISRAEQMDCQYLESSINKRTRGIDENETWRVVTKSRKRSAASVDSMSRITEKIEVSITCKDALPKQLKLAQLLKNNNIEKILRIKYINPFKVKMQFEDDLDMEKLISCPVFKEMKWNFHKSMEVGVSYGVIKNVEIDCKEDELRASITSDTEILAIKRLSARKKEGNGWTESEAVRLCFKGSSLPAYIRIYGVKVTVEPYVFPVTQCSYCWRFGHIRKVCPNKNIVCPKCGKHHENCDTTSYKCVNCKGNHMALNKTCPIYAKEKKLRSIMAEFNCTYKRALTMYVPTSTPIPDTRFERWDTLSLTQPQQTEQLNPFEPVPNPTSTQPSTSYAAVCSRKVTKETTNDKTTNRKKSKRQHHQKINDISFDWECLCSDTDCEPKSSEKVTEPNNTNENASKNMKNKTDTIQYLIEKIKVILFKKNQTIAKKIQSCVQLILEWLINVFWHNICELPCFNFFTINQDD